MRRETVAGREWRDGVHWPVTLTRVPSTECGSRSILSRSAKRSPLPPRAPRVTTSPVAGGAVFGSVSASAAPNARPLAMPPTERPRDRAASATTMQALATSTIGDNATSAAAAPVMAAHTAAPKTASAILIGRRLLRCNNRARPTPAQCRCLVNRNNVSTVRVAGHPDIGRRRRTRPALLSMRSRCAPESDRRSSTVTARRRRWLQAAARRGDAPNRGRTPAPCC